MKFRVNLAARDFRHAFPEFDRCHRPARTHSGRLGIMKTGDFQMPFFGENYFAAATSLTALRRAGHSIWLLTGVVATWQTGRIRNRGPSLPSLRRRQN